MPAKQATQLHATQGDSDCIQYRHQPQVRPQKGSAENQHQQVSCESQGPGFRQGRRYTQRYGQVSQIEGASNHHGEGSQDDNGQQGLPSIPCHESTNQLNRAADDEHNPEAYALGLTSESYRIATDTRR